MGFNTKIILNNDKFIQSTGDTLNLSGDTTIYGGLRIIDGNQGVGKVIVSNSEGFGQWSGTSTSLLTSNGIIFSGDTLVLGGSLDNNINIEHNNNKFNIIGDTGTTIQGFDVDTGFANSSVNIVELQGDGKILVGGSFIEYKEQLYSRIIRLDSLASVDNTFIIGDGFNNNVNDIKIQIDDKIIVVGDFTTYSGVTANRIIRLNLDGSIDNTFNTGTGFNNSVEVLYIQSDGKILVGGDFTTYSGVTANRLIRLNDNGSIDTTFNFNNSVFSINQQSDGKILVGGNFTSYSGVTNYRIIRLETNGFIDSTFNTGLGFDQSVLSIEIQSDNKIILGGSFNTYKVQSYKGLIRLNSDGSIDNTFNIGTGFNFRSQDIKIQSDNKILVVGNFTTYSGVTANRIIRLNTDGSIDTNFNTGNGFDFTTLSIKIQDDNKLVIGGSFTSYSGYTSGSLIRLYSDGSIDKSFTPILTTVFDNGLILYENDYSIDFDDRTLITKLYVDQYQNNMVFTGITNLGGGQEVFHQIQNKNIELNSLVAGDNVSLESTNDEITVNVTGGATGLNPIVAALIFD